MKILFSSGWTLLLAFGIFAQNPADKCGENGDDVNSLVVAVYNFIPDATAKTANLREILKTPASFVETLEADRSLRVLDSRTPVLSSDATLELPEIDERFDPTPAESGAKVYFVGKISKSGGGFKYSSKESEDLTDKTGKYSTLGTKSLKIEVALRSLEDTYLEIKKKK